MRASFVESILVALLKDGTVRESDSILTVCAGIAEHALFNKLGFANVLVTNLDERMHAGQLLHFDGTAKTRSVCHSQTGAST